MGKKSKRKKPVSARGKPLVSICTPTYNRRRFLPFLIKCYLSLEGNETQCARRFQYQIILVRNRF